MKKKMTFDKVEELVSRVIEEVEAKLLAKCETMGINPNWYLFSHEKLGGRWSWHWSEAFLLGGVWEPDPDDYDEDDWKDWVAILGAGNGGVEISRHDNEEQALAKIRPIFENAEQWLEDCVIEEKEKELQG